MSEDIEDQHIPTAGESISLDVAGNFSDPDGDTLTFTTSITGGAATVVVINNSILFIIGVAEGTATIVVTASDGSLSVTDELVVTVGNRAPEVSEDIEDQHIPTAGRSIYLDVAGNFSDPNDDDLTFTAGSDAEATATVLVSGSVLVITGEAAGTATITVTASDGSLSVEDEFVVTVGNRAPEVSEDIEDQHIPTAGEFILLDVSGNFSDPEGDALTFTAESDAMGVATVSVDGSTLRIIGVADGTATITVTASDTLGTVEATFELTVGNRDPEANTIPNQTVVAGMSITLDVSSYFSDPDNDDLSFKAESNSDATATVMVSGSVLTITGVADGTATIEVTASDPDGASVLAQFDVAVTASDD